MTGVTLTQCSRKNACVHPEAINGWLPATAEYFAVRKSGRVEKQCYKCLAELARIAYKNNPQKYIDISRRSRQKHIEESRAREREAYRLKRLAQPDYDRLRHIQWRKTNPDKYRAQAHRKYAANPDKAHEAGRKWALRNPDRVRANGRVKAQRRLAQKRNLPATLTVNEWQFALDYFGHTCAVCGRPADFWTILAADHWTPVSKGGGTTARNIVPLCHARKGIPPGEPCCNNSKGNKDPEVWLIERYGKRKAAAILNRINAYFAKLV